MESSISPLFLANQTIQGGSGFPNLFENCSTFQRGPHTNKAIFLIATKEKHCP
jgi:hypothetical protein